MLGIISSQRDDSGCTRGIVVGTSIEDFLTQVAQMVVMCRKDVATIVAYTRDLGNHVEQLVTLQELVVHIDTIPQLIPRCRMARPQSVISGRSKGSPPVSTTVKGLGICFLGMVSSA